MRQGVNPSLLKAHPPPSRDSPPPPPFRLPREPVKDAPRRESILGEGPLTLSSVEGSSGGGPHIADPSRPPLPHSNPLNPVIPMPREESRTCPLTPFLVFLPLPPGNDISAMLQGNIADMSIKQGGWAGLNISLRVGGASPKCDTNPLT